MKKLTLILIIISVSSTAIAQKADDVVGFWLTSGKNPARVQIYKSGDKYNGKIVWLTNPNENGKPKLDKKNPDPKKRQQPIVGMVMLSGFVFDKDEWEDGKIYDPESGNSYSCTMELSGRNKLKVRGYIGLSVFGRTEVWTRTTAP